jgi:hypothetical protein
VPADKLREPIEILRFGYGHMGGWPNEFQVICLEKLDYFSDGSVLEYQTPTAQKRIKEWYAKQVKK